MIRIEADRFEIVVDRGAAVARRLLEPRRASTRSRPSNGRRRARPGAASDRRGRNGGAPGPRSPGRAPTRAASSRHSGLVASSSRISSAGPSRPARHSTRIADDQPGAGELSGGLGQVRPPVARARRIPLALQLVAATLLEQSARRDRRGGASAPPARRSRRRRPGGRRSRTASASADRACRCRARRSSSGGRSWTAISRWRVAVLELAVVMEARAQDSRRVGVELELRQRSRRRAARLAARSVPSSRSRSSSALARSASPPAAQSSW